MSSVTFDYAMGRPWVINSRIQQAIDDAVKRGKSIEDSIARAEINELRSNESYRAEYERALKNPDVDILSVTISPSVGLELPAGTRDADADLARWHARFDELDWLKKITNQSQIQETTFENSVGIILNTQHLDLFCKDLEDIRKRYNEGIRIFQLTYNSQNSIGTGCLDRSDCGLSQYGLQVISLLNNLDGVIDLSHCAPETTRDAIQHSKDPVAFTHTFCKELVDHPRAKTDEELQLIAKNGGYVGILAIPWFLQPDESSSSIEVFLDHIEHAVSVIGVENVGIGTDFAHVSANCPPEVVSARKNAFKSQDMGGDYSPRYGEGFGEFQDYSDWPKLRHALETRLSENDINKILGENFSRFYTKVQTNT